MACRSPRGSRAAVENEQRVDDAREREADDEEAAELEAAPHADAGERVRAELDRDDELCAACLRLASVVAPYVRVVARRCQTPPTGAWSPRARGPWRAQLMTPGAEMPSMHLQVSASRARRRVARALLPWVPLAVRRRLALRGERAAAGAAVVETGGPCATAVHRLCRGGPPEGRLRPVRGSYRARSGPSTIDDVAAAAGGRSPST